jgi:hypothetical protein
MAVVLTPDEGATGEIVKEFWTDIDAALGTVKSTEREPTRLTSPVGPIKKHCAKS